MVRMDRGSCLRCGVPGSSVGGGTFMAVKADPLV